MYSLDTHGRMIADHARTEAYFHALEQCVTQDSIVADIGTGCGTFALCAAKLGAKKVYAIDDADVIETANEIAKHNNLDHRIEFIRKKSTDVSLEIRADIIVSDLRGVLPLFATHPADIIDARKRLLAPGGVLIPRRDIIFAAPVESKIYYRSLTDPWEQLDSGIDGTACRRAAVNNWYRHSAHPEQLLAPAAIWAELDYNTLDTTEVNGDCDWIVSRNGMLHGLSIWFDAGLLGNFGYSNAPADTDTVYGSAFFPLETAVNVMEGDRITTNIRAKELPGDYVWTWDTDVYEQRGNARKAHATQSTFFGAMLNLDELHKTAIDSRPGLNTLGGATKTVLALLQTGKKAEDISTALMNAFPEEFSEFEAAGIFTRRTIRQYASKS